MSVCELPVLFFFFQAEDGIRDGHVTGVQTCALPISAEPGAEVRAALADLRTLVTDDAERTWLERAVGSDAAAWEAEVGQEQIGRASCRERGEIAVVGGSLRNRNRQRT